MLTRKTIQRVMAQNRSYGEDPMQRHQLGGPEPVQKKPQENTQRNEVPHIRSAYLDVAFAVVAELAQQGLRCPNEEGIKALVLQRGHLIKKGEAPSNTISALVQKGLARSEVYGHNWRVIEIMKGPHRGARTMMPSFGSGKPYKVFEPPTEM